LAVDQADRQVGLGHLFGDIADGDDEHLLDDVLRLGSKHHHAHRGEDAGVVALARNQPFAIDLDRCERAAAGDGWAVWEQKTRRWRWRACWRCQPWARRELSTAASGRWTPEVNQDHVAQHLSRQRLLVPVDRRNIPEVHCGHPPP
jgi:hypothetical protein